ncbi:hypothetical protein DPMN_100337 [Dreissena polymorpha]|uniref:Uncharacterized protein n=1 Tax=Dreissena polymorpha TaxID=45954 RepID=A0A9D4LH84_DREPO|nr:hypothetical protein DPMN_100337 [Dreissena polymorpha]
MAPNRTCNVMLLCIISSTLTLNRRSAGIMGLQCITILIGYYFYCCVLGLHTGFIKRTTSNKDLTEKDQ